jgi:putative protein-disulfide isomerase
MQRIHKHYGEQLPVEVLSGGMVRGDRIGAIGTVAPYISWAYKEVEHRTGVRFGEKFLHGVLAQGTSVFTSLPAAFAMTALKLHQPHHALAFAHRLQHAVYYDGIEPSVYECYAPYAEEFGFAREHFIYLMHQPDTQRRANEEFALCTQLGITGFPTVLVQCGQELTLIARGFVEYETLRNRIDAALSTAQTL